ncbi:MAG: CDP-glycerol glycerophosphotransferase, partial [Flavobacteriaceae bacterium]|nr:CDP-glycerol glycerophosphotransferase [Flavobacteriaceae bacterium]
KVDPLFPVIESKELKPTILFASTFTNSMSLAHNDEVFEELKRLVKLEKWNWLFTLHPKMDKEIVTKFNALKGNIEFIPVLETLDPLKKANVMLSDTSSIITEFIIQEKPVVTFKNKKPGNHLIDIDNASEIEKSLEYALSRPKSIIENIERYIEVIHPYTDGKSSERVIEASINFFKNEDVKKIKRKPLNIIRKFKIRKRLGYFKI